MKTFRLFTGTIALLMIALAGCGTKSPDFTSELLSMTLSADPSTGSVAVGDTVQFSAAGKCSTPPGSPTDEVDCEIKNTDVKWTVTSSPTGKTVGTIDKNGLFTAGPDTGTATVKGTSGDKGASDDLVITVGPAALRSLVIVKPEAPATIPVASSQEYKVQGVYSDGVTREIDPDANPISWETGTPAVASIDSESGITTTATGLTIGTSLIKATSPGVTSAESLLTVSGSTLVSLSGITLDPPSATVAVGNTADYQLIGVYSDGEEHPVSNSDIDWTISAGGVGSIDFSAATGVTATGLIKGTATITATLKEGVAPGVTDPNQRKATGTLTVVDGFCTAPLVAPTATTSTSKENPLCLLCDVVAPNNVIDANLTNYASLNSTVGLLSGVTLVVNSNAAAFPATSVAPSTAGFIIGRPAGALLSAEVLSGLTITTLLSGEPQESRQVSSGGILDPLVRLTLLGLLGNSDTALLSLTTTKPYDAISLTFSTGVVSALTTTRVFGACGTVDLDQVPASAP